MNWFDSDSNQEDFISVPTNNLLDQYVEDYLDQIDGGMYLKAIPLEYINVPKFPIRECTIKEIKIAYNSILSAKKKIDKLFLFYTKLIDYKQKNTFSVDINDVCPLCLDTFNQCTNNILACLLCNKCFHKDCIDSLKKSNYNHRYLCSYCCQHSYYVYVNSIKDKVKKE